MDLYVVRHAQSTNNRGDREELDPPLTDEGTRQALQVATALHKLHITTLYCSPFRRTLQTVAPIADMLRLAPRVEMALHEWAA